MGTGFSFTDSVMGLSTNESEVATNLYSALIQFFTVFSGYQKNDFYVTGEVGGWGISCVWVSLHDVLKVCPSEYTVIEAMPSTVTCVVVSRLVLRLTHTHTRTHTRMHARTHARMHIT